MRAAQEQDPYRAMLRGGALPAVAVGVVAVVVATLVDQGRGTAGALLAVVVVVASFGSSLAVMSRVAKVDPTLVMAVALLTYVTKVGLLGLLVLLLGGAEWLSGTAFGATAVAVALAWMTGELVAFTRVRTLVASPGARTDTMTES